MRTWISVSGLTVALASVTQGQSLLKEGFEDGNRDGWYLTSGGEVTITDDAAGLASGKALQYRQTDDAFGGTDDSLKHSVVFTVKRASATTMSLEVVVDGTKTLRADVTVALRTRFDEVGFAASHRAADFRVDNIEVTAGDSAAPSSSSAGALAVQARCEPCTIEIGTNTTLTADVRDAGGRPVTYLWGASDDGRGGTASHTVTVDVVKSAGS
jgi:hypothetical protein